MEFLFLKAYEFGGKNGLIALIYFPVVLLTLVLILIAMYRKYRAQIMWHAVYSRRYHSLTRELMSFRETNLKAGVDRITVLLTESRKLFEFRSMLLVKFDRTSAFFAVISEAIRQRETEFVNLARLEENAARLREILLRMGEFHENQLTQEIDALQSKLRPLAH